MAIAAALPGPGTGDESLALIRARREAGERLLLPSAAADQIRPARRVAWPIAAAALLIIAVGVFSSTPELSAVAVDSELTLSPTSPRAGDRIGVTYSPLPSLFSSEDRLLLRAAVRTRHSESYGRAVEKIVLDTLHRDASGVFRGAFSLPDSAVFALLAVEDTAASVVDDRTDRPWEVMIYGADGNPTFEALEQRENAYLGVSWEEAYATARRKAELYPGQFRSWSALEFFERQVLGKAGADSAANARITRVDALVATYRASPSVPPDELGAIAFRAYAQKDTAALDYWVERLLREAPNHPQTIQQAVIRALGKYPRSATRWDERLLGDVEEIWQRHGPVARSGNVIFQVALGVARQENDVPTYRRWVHRLMAADPSTVRYYASAFLRYPELREEGLTILREHLGRVHLDVRGLGTTRAGHERAVAAEKRRLLATLGRGLLDSGNERGGLDTLALAVSGGWDLALFRDVAAARVKAGDTLGAIELEARIAADPRTTVARRDSAATVATRILGASAWRDAVADAAVSMAKTLMASAVVRAFIGEPQLTSGGGQTVRLRELVAGKPALVVFWSRFCGPALEALPRIDSVATVLRGQGVPAFLILDEPPSPELTAFLRERKVATPVYHDIRGEAKSALRNFGTPAYYVLDAAGRIRFTWARTEDELLVQVAAVSETGLSGTGGAK